MKNTLLIFLLSTLTPFAVHAAKSSNSPWYIGFIGCLMDAGRGVTDDAINLGFDAGYQVNRYFAPELELTRTIVDGETSGDYAELDEQGRYKIKLPFDREDSRR